MRELGIGDHFIETEKQGFERYSAKKMFLGGTVNEIFRVEICESKLTKNKAKSIYTLKMVPKKIADLKQAIDYLRIPYNCLC